MHKMKQLVFMLFILILSGCSNFADGNRVSAPSSENKTVPPMKTPPGMSIGYDTLYPIPQRNYPSKPKAVDISPPSTFANKDIGHGWFSW